MWPDWIALDQMMSEHHYADGQKEGFWDWYNFDFLFFFFLNFFLICNL